MRVFIFIFLFCPLVAVAVLPDEVLSDIALEREAREISRLLRCVVCENQTIDESPSALARDMRVLVRRLLVEGKDRGEILLYVRERYGDDVLLLPIFGWGNLGLWLSMPILLVIGVVLLFVYYRKNMHDLN